MSWRRGHTIAITPANAAALRASLCKRGALRATIANLLGDLWLNGEPRCARALAVPEVSLHLYEKHTARAGRKMGHLSATADTAEEAVARVMEARSRL